MRSPILRREEGYQSSFSLTCFETRCSHSHRSARSPYASATARWASRRAGSLAYKDMRRYWLAVSQHSLACRFDSCLGFSIASIVGPVFRRFNLARWTITQNLSGFAQSAWPGPMPQSICGHDCFYPGAVWTEPLPDGRVGFRPADHEAAIVTVQDGPSVRCSDEDEILGESAVFPIHKCKHASFLGRF